jgi:hypothetical protein
MLFFPVRLRSPSSGRRIAPLFLASRSFADMPRSPASLRCISSPKRASRDGQNRRCRVRVPRSQLSSDETMASAPSLLRPVWLHQPTPGEHTVLRDYFPLPLSLPRPRIARHRPPPLDLTGATAPATISQRRRHL